MNRWKNASRFRCTLVLLMGMLAPGATAATIPANSRLIGYIDAQTVSGITFDDIVPGSPIVGTGDGARLLRLDPNDAHTVQTYALPALNTTRGLDYLGGGRYYQTRNQPNTLYVADAAAGTTTKVGSSLGVGHLNFLDTALDPTTGRLWGLTDMSGGYLYEIDRTSGAAVMPGVPVTGTGLDVSLAIGLNGQFFTSDFSGSTTAP